MKNLREIKIIKRQSEQAENNNSLACGVKGTALLTKKIERELANKVLSWISKQREEKRAEQLKNIRAFFGQINTVPNTIG